MNLPSLFAIGRTWHQANFLKQNKTSLNLVFLLLELSLPYYLPITRERTDGFLKLYTVKQNDRFSF